MLDAIQYSYADMLNTLLRVPNWLTASALVIAGILLALIANTLIVHTLRNTLGVRHPKPRSRLTRSKGPLRLALIVLALGLVVRIAPIRESAATVFGNILNLAFIALLGWTSITAVQISSQVYLRGFTLDAEDNLLARKHVTQVRILMPDRGDTVWSQSVHAALGRLMRT